MITLPVWNYGIKAGSYVIKIMTDDGSDDDKFASIILRKNGVVINTWYPDKKEWSISADITTSAGEYYYVIVRQSDGDEAISSPIWIE